MTATAKTIGGCLPSAGERTFLAACLAHPAEALSAWDECLRQRSLDEMEGPSYHLLPLLYRNLQRAAYDGPAMPRLKGLYRRNWYASQKRFHMLETVIAQFRAADIPVMLLKGAALSFLYYPDPYARAMMDGDILVPPNEADRAIACLRAAGWSCKAPLRPHHLRSMNGNAFINATGEELDLHWRLFPDDSGDDKIFWQRAVPMEFRDGTVLTLSPTDHLFHTCIHGYQWNRVNPMRWIVDAALILEKVSDSIEWDYLVGQARERHLILRLRNSLNLLQATCGVKIPEQTVIALNDALISRFEDFEHRILTREGRLHRDPLEEFIWPLQRVWCLNRRRNPQCGWFGLWLRFPSALGAELFSSPWRLPATLLASGARKLKRLFKGV